MSDLNNLPNAEALAAMRGSEESTRFTPQVQASIDRRALLKLVDELAAASQRVVIGIDKWNAAMESIIGRVPNYSWGDLEELRALLKHAGLDKETP